VRGILAEFACELLPRLRRNDVARVRLEREMDERQHGVRSRRAQRRGPVGFAPCKRADRLRIALHAGTRNEQIHRHLQMVLFAQQ
jgi:hypothetical protein